MPLSRKEGETRALSLVDKTSDKVLISDTHFVEWMEPGFDLILLEKPYFLIDFIKNNFWTVEEYAAQIKSKKTFRFSLGYYDTKHILPRFKAPRSASIDLARLYVEFLKRLVYELPGSNLEVCEILSYPLDSLRVDKKWWCLNEQYYGQRQARQYCVDEFNTELKDACKSYGWTFLYRPSYFFDYLKQRDQQEVLQKEFVDDTNYHISWTYSLHERKNRGEFFKLTGEKHD